MSGVRDHRVGAASQCWVGPTIQRIGNSLASSVDMVCQRLLKYKTYYYHHHSLKFFSVNAILMFLQRSLRAQVQAGRWLASKIGQRCIS